MLTSNDELYGTTYYGGTNSGLGLGTGAGTIFKFAPGAGTLTTVYNFCSQIGCADGSQGFNDDMNPIFQATVEATEEAIVNAMVGAETMTGYQGHQVIALPHTRLREVLTKYNRLAPLRKN